MMDHPVDYYENDCESKDRPFLQSDLLLPDLENLDVFMMRVIPTTHGFTVSINIVVLETVSPPQNQLENM